MKTRTLTILQADLVGSTDAASAISRQEMADYIEEVSAQIIHAVRFYGGNPFKFTGDGYLATFESASDCLNAAQKLQRDLQLRNLSIGGQRTAALRVILHTADLVVTADDVLGDGMATVARLEKLTPPGAIYVTETVYGICKRAEFEFEFVDAFHLRGLPDPVRVYELKYHEHLLVEEQVWVLASDIKRFTQLTETLSPESLEEYLAALHRLHRHAARAFSGILAKILGDRVLMTYQSADDAIAAAIALQEGASSHSRQRPDLPPIQLTIGVASGDVYRFAGDMYGAPVNTAFLMASRLDDYQIAMTAEVYATLQLEKSLFDLVSGPLQEWPDFDLAVFASLRPEPLQPIVRSDD